MWTIWISYGWLNFTKNEQNGTYLIMLISLNTIIIIIINLSGIVRPWSSHKNGNKHFGKFFINWNFVTFWRNMLNCVLLCRAKGKHVVGSKSIWIAWSSCKQNLHIYMHFFLFLLLLIPLYITYYILLFFAIYYVILYMLCYNNIMLIYIICFIYLFI